MQKQNIVHYRSMPSKMYNVKCQRSRIGEEIALWRWLLLLLYNTNKSDESHDIEVHMHVSYYIAYNCLHAPIMFTIYFFIFRTFLFVIYLTNGEMRKKYRIRKMFDIKHAFRLRTVRQSRLLLPITIMALSNLSEKTTFIHRKLARTELL